MSYRINGLLPASIALNTAGASLWNPHSTHIIRVIEVSIVTAVVLGVGQFKIFRISTRGTPGSTITPSIANDARRMLAPPSGVLLDLGVYSVEPTLEALNSWRFSLMGNNDGAGIIYRMNTPIDIPPGAGISLIGTLPISEITFEWSET